MPRTKVQAPLGKKRVNVPALLQLQVNEALKRQRVNDFIGLKRIMPGAQQVQKPWIPACAGMARMRVIDLKSVPRTQT
ncbi:MAG: hypothetical protein WA121_00295 [Syntrophales bacterium]